MGLLGGKVVHVDVLGCYAVCVHHWSLRHGVGWAAMIHPRVGNRRALFDDRGSMLDVRGPIRHGRCTHTARRSLLATIRTHSNAAYGVAVLSR